MLALPAAAHAAPGQPVDGPGMSPVLTWDAESVYGGAARSPTLRPMSPAELKLARERAEVFFRALQGVPSFAQPARHSSFLTSWAVLDAGPVLVQNLIVYWSAPRDTRRRADGAYFGVMGGAHEMLYVDTNRLPNAPSLAEREHNAWWRGVGDAGRSSGAFPEPRIHGTAGGGNVYGGYWIATRDGRPALEPAPLAPLLQGDIAALKRRIEQSASSAIGALRELEASMTPEAMAARRAKREQAWAKMYRNPDTMQRELDAAARNDQQDYEQRQARFGAAESPTGPRAALAALERQLAALDAAGRSAAACGAPDPAFPADLAMRWHAAGPGAPPDCKPMVRIRQDLLTPGRPEDVRMVSAWLRDAECGRAWSQPPRDHICSRITSALAGLDWAAVRRSWGWKEQP